MSAALKSATPSKEIYIPDLTGVEKEQLEDQYKAQSKYYENGKPWKNHLQKILWKFVKSKNFKYDKNMLMRHIAVQLNNDVLTVEDKDDTFNLKEIEEEIDRFIQYYVLVLKDYEQHFGETDNVLKLDKNLFTNRQVATSIIGIDYKNYLHLRLDGMNLLRCGIKK